MLFRSFSRQEFWSGLPCPLPGDLPNPGIEPRSVTLQVDSLPAEPQGKLKNTRVGSLSLLQQIFPTQQPNWGVLHCRQILYQLSYVLLLSLFYTWQNGGSEKLSNLSKVTGEGNGNPLQYSGLENSMDCIVHGVARSPTRLRDFHFQC